jgi:flagellin-like protein
MNKKVGKKGITPVVATVLLISLVLILAIIIYLWARAFLPEMLQKDLGNGPAPIKDACEAIVFSAAYDVGQVSVANDGNVPLYGFEILVKDSVSGSLGSLGSFNRTIKTGESASFDVGDISSGSDVTVIPVLIGETENKERKAYVCGEDYAQSITV